mmetsp:Transcript_11873/g.19563  ORF Transcript_11873/g.19563 Transcript_11873/m.19563 type:complete len:101 (+) Transcript_11873:297-599(+)
MPITIDLDALNAIDTLRKNSLDFVKSSTIFCRAPFKLIVADKVVRMSREVQLLVMFAGLASTLSEHCYFLFIGIAQQKVEPSLLRTVIPVLFGTTTVLLL